jgi:uncharacterized membrane protein
MEVRGMEKTKYANILADALDFLPKRVSEIMDELDACINKIGKTTDEQTVKHLNYIWMELDSLKTELVNCAKFFKYFFRGDQQ